MSEIPAFYPFIDAGPLIAVYNKTDQHYKQVWDFLQTFTHELITTDACIAETMYALRRSTQVQGKFAQDIADGIWQGQALENHDFLYNFRIFESVQRLKRRFG